MNCIMCDQTIPQERLDALPGIEICVKCASRVVRHVNDRCTSVKEYLIESPDSDNNFDYIKDVVVDMMR